MNASPRWVLWLSAAVALIVGFLLIMRDSAAGWFLILLGIIDIGAAARPGQALAPSNRGLVRWGLVGLTLLLVVLVIVAGAVFLFK